MLASTIASIGVGLLSGVVAYISFRYLNTTLSVMDLARRAVALVVLGFALVVGPSYPMNFI